jgi:hypothetical protein
MDPNGSETQFQQFTDEIAGLIHLCLSRGTGLRKSQDPFGSLESLVGLLHAALSRHLHQLGDKFYRLQVAVSVCRNWEIALLSTASQNNLLCSEFSRTPWDLRISRCCLPAPVACLVPPDPAERPLRDPLRTHANQKAHGKDKDRICRSAYRSLVLTCDADCRKLLHVISEWFQLDEQFDFLLEDDNFKKHVNKCSVKHGSFWDDLRNNGPWSSLEKFKLCLMLMLFPLTVSGCPQK